MPKKNNLISNNTEVIDNLSISHPHLSLEWHPIKNGILKPHEVTSKSVKRVWWKCPQADDHEWEVRVVDRVKGPRCPFCIFFRLSESNSLFTLHPKLASQWHPTKNANLSPKDVIGTGNKKYWWKCSTNPTHEWQDSIGARKRKDGTYRDCPLCKATPLAITNPEIAAQWHPIKNLPLTPMDVVAGSATYAWWKCEKGKDHEWRTKIVERLKTGCPFCDGKKLSITNSLESRYPELAKELHPTKNGNIKPCEVFGGEKKKYWWKCEKGSDHEWEASIQHRARGDGCPICRGLKVVASNCVANTHPELIVQWHPTKNGSLTPFDIIAGNSESVWWLCQENPQHEWQTSCKNRTKPGKKNVRGCPYCSNQRVCQSNSLAIMNPALGKEWHPTKNENLTAYDVTEGSGIIVWWQCSQNSEHEWQAKPVSRKYGTGCPLCNHGWTIDRVRLFVKSLLSHINVMTPAELYVIFQQHGVSNNPSKAKSFLQALKTGKFPKEELEKFANNEDSLVDSFISDPTKRIDFEAEFLSEESSKSISELEISDPDEELPVVSTTDVLALLDSKITANIDKEAVDFFISSAIAKIWRHAFLNEQEAIKQLTNYYEGSYSQEVKSKFLEQYEGALNLPIPNGYNFKLNGKLHLPNLMQRFTAFMIQKSKRYGNWSGTGAGKTLSAILSSRVINAKLTIICCPNSVVKGWKENIESIFPDSIVETKDLNISPASNSHHYVILNYEFFQQPNSESKLKQFLKSAKIDFVVIDEIHYSKQRVVEDVSKRKKVISAMLSEASIGNGNLHVLGMSATPVINNLFEGKTLIELITGLHHDELNTNPSVGNCIALYQKFVSYGLRWLPQYKQRLDVKTIEIDCLEFIEEIKNSSINGSMVDLEGILTKAKIPVIGLVG